MYVVINFIHFLPDSMKLIFKKLLNNENIKNSVSDKYRLHVAILPPLFV